MRRCPEVLAVGFAPRGDEADYGHDAFLVEQEKMIPPLAEFMAGLG